MNKGYKVEGNVVSAFILNGMIYRVGAKIDTTILESDLQFVKSHSRLDKVEDLNATPRPVATTNKSVKGAVNELPKQPSNNGKVTNKAKVSMA